MTDEMAKYQDNDITKKNKVTSGMKNPTKFRLNKMLKTGGLEKYDWLLLPDKNWNLKMIQVQIVDKEAYEKDTQNVVKKYISPLKMIGVELDKIDDIEDIYYIIKDAHIELNIGSYFYYFECKFKKSAYDLFMSIYETQKKGIHPIITVNGKTIDLSYNRYDYAIINRCLYRNQEIPEFVFGMDFNNIEDVPVKITNTMPIRKFCDKCGVDFIISNNRQKYCESCGNEIQNEHTESWIEYMASRGLYYNRKLRKFVPFIQSSKEDKYLTKKQYIAMRRRN